MNGTTEASGNTLQPNEDVIYAIFYKCFVLYTIKIFIKLEYYFRTWHIINIL